MKRNGTAEKILLFIEKLPLYAIVTLLIGIWLLIFPERALEVALRISGTVLLIYALYRFIAVFMLDTDIFESSASLFSTSVTLILGLLLAVNPLLMAGILSTLFGIYLTVIGLFGVWRSSVMRDHYESFGIVENGTQRTTRVITAAISLLLGISLIVFPLALEKFTAIITGICLIAEGVKSIALKIIELRRSNHGDTIEADFTDKSDTLK